MHYRCGLKYVAPLFKKKKTTFWAYGNSIWNSWFLNLSLGCKWLESEGKISCLKVYVESWLICNTMSCSNVSQGFPQVQENQRSGDLSELGCDINTLFVILLIWAQMQWAESLQRLEAMREYWKLRLTWEENTTQNYLFFAVRFFSVDIILAINLVFVSLVCMVNQQHLYSTLFMVVCWPQPRSSRVDTGVHLRHRRLKMTHYASSEKSLKVLPTDSCTM